MRQRAFDTVKLSIQNQLGCDAATADKIVDRVVDPKSDRISVAQMHKLELVLNAREEMGSLTSALLNGNGKDVTDSLDRMGQLITSDKAANATKRLPMESFPELTQLVNSAKNGDAQNAKAIMDRLSGLIDQLGDSNWGANLSDDQTKTAKRVKEGALELLGEACKEATKAYVEKGLAEQGDAIQTKWQALDNQPPNVLDSSQVQAFTSTALPTALGVDSSQWSIATSGSGGAVIVRDQGIPSGGVVIKFERLEGVNACVETSNAIATANTELSKKGLSLPIEGMAVAKANFSASDKAAFKNHMTYLEQNGSSAAQLKANRHQTNIDKQDWGAMQIPLISNATDLNKLPLLDRVVLAKGNALPNQLGNAMILGRMFGMGDHVGITSGTNGPRFAEGFSNLTNLMINHDTGKLIFIDYAMTPSRKDGRSGYSSDSMVNSFTAISNFLHQSLSSANALQTLNGIADADSPLTSLMDIVFTTSQKGSGSMFNDEESGALESLSAKDRSRFAANVLLGMIDAMKLVAENPEAFTNGEPMFEDPQKVMPQLVQLSQGLDQIARNIGNCLPLFDA